MIKLGFSEVGHGQGQGASWGSLMAMSSLSQAEMRGFRQRTWAQSPRMFLGLNEGHLRGSAVIA